jgi:hypothetical protein
VPVSTTAGGRRRAAERAGRAHVKENPYSPSEAVISDIAGAVADLAAAAFFLQWQLDAGRFVRRYRRRQIIVDAVLATTFTQSKFLKAVF